MSEAKPAESRPPQHVHVLWVWLIMFTVLLIDGCFDNQQAERLVAKDPAPCQQ